MNASNDPKLEYLSNGISERLIDSLSQLPQLKVIARSSAFRYKNRDADREAVGKALGVGAIVTGRVVGSEDHLQVSAELVNTGDSTQIWGEHYDRAAADLQTVQEEMALTISERLSVKLTPPQHQQIAKRPTSNAAAYQLYLVGSFHAASGGWAGARTAIEYYQQALALDPRFALAYARESIAYRNMAVAVTAGLDAPEAVARASEAARKALELDPALPDAHVAVAVAKIAQWDWAGAEAAFQRSLQLNPNSAMAHGSYAS